MFTGHTGNVTALAAAPNGKLLASADDRGDIIVWDLAAGRLAKRLRGHARSAVWSLDWSVESSVLVSGGADATVRVWDIRPFTAAPSAANADKPATEQAAASGAQAGAAAAATAKAEATAAGKAAAGGKGKDVVVSADQISAFPTKKSPVYKVRFTQMNLVLAGGAYLP